MSQPLDNALDRFDAIDLSGLDRSARLQTRKDRKYIVDPNDLVAVLDQLPSETLALETGGGRWSPYESTYFDTRALDSFRLAVLKRRNRFKVRTRHYGQTATTMIEVKTKDRRGRTAKHRRSLADHAIATTDTVRHYAERFDQVEPYADDLTPRLTTSYRRATLVLTNPASRLTIDADYRAVDTDGRVTGLGRELIVETKTDGTPSPADHLLWQAGYRPVKFSKYATGLAALNPDLPRNRWHRILTHYFDQPLRTPVIGRA